MNGSPHKLRHAFYGDDFTGSTDALEFLSRAGAKTVLFIEPPTHEQIKQYKDLDAIGIAGMTRAMSPKKMEETLTPAFEVLKSFNIPHVHYKVCSTFDSSPTIGSIGKAIDVGASVFDGPFVPLLVAAPALGRYCTFGNLFARMGIGSTGKIHRLDRHPSMSKHPVTPAHESDLRLHLSQQTTKAIGLLDILQINSDEQKAKESLDNIISSGAEIILFDGLYEEQMSTIGSLIDAYAEENKTLFSVGSSGIEMALGKHWQREGILQPVQHWSEPEETNAILVVSGSCSPITSGQIAWAIENGFDHIPLDTASIAESDDLSTELEDVITTAISTINKGRSIILHTSFNATDERVEKTKTVLKKKGLHEEDIKFITAQVYGTALGLIIKAVAAKTALKRVVIAGGDTSSFAARAMGIEAVEMIAPLSPGAPLCRTYAPGSPVDGLEVNFKGGQVGAEDYFGMVKKGSIKKVQQDFTTIKNSKQS